MGAEASAEAPLVVQPSHQRRHPCLPRLRSEALWVAEALEVLREWVAGPSSVEVVVLLLRCSVFANCFRWRVGENTV